MIFTSFNVQPSYGRDSVFLSWTLLPGYSDGKVYVYRSPTGIPVSNDWEMLNENSPVEGVTVFHDGTFYDKHDFRKWYYRLLWVKNSQEYDSPIIGMFSEGLNKTEYGMLYTMRRREYLRMRKGNGVRAFHCVPTTTGKKAPTYDPIMGKNLVHCAEGDALSSNFDQAFRTCFQTWIEVTKIGSQNLEQQSDGSGFKEKQQFELRLLAFPQPEVGHIIILPKSDQRFIVDGSVQPYMFKGYLPVAWDVQVSLLSKSDPRHKLVVPDLLDDPDYPVEFRRTL